MGSDADAQSLKPHQRPQSTPGYGHHGRDHNDDNDDNDDSMSTVSEMTHDWEGGDDRDDHSRASQHSQLRRGSSAPNQHLSVERKRASMRVSIFGGLHQTAAAAAAAVERNDGRAMITSDDMLAYLQNLSLDERAAKVLKQASIEDPRVLMGWQVSERRDSSCVCLII